MAYPDMAYSDAEAARQAGGQTSRQTARRIVGRAVQHKAVRTRKTTEARTAVGAWIRTVRSTVKGTVKAALIGAIALALLTGGSAVAGVFAQSDDAAQSNLADITLVRTVDDDGLVLAQPVGLAGSPDALYLVESPPRRARSR